MEGAIQDLGKNGEKANVTQLYFPPQGKTFYSMEIHIICNSTCVISNRICCTMEDRTKRVDFSLRKGISPFLQKDVMRVTYCIPQEITLSQTRFWENIP